MAITVVLTVVGGILAALGCIIGFLFYRGYGKIKAKKMDGKVYFSLSLHCGVCPGSTLS
jgi:hypothetical protein